MTPLGRAAAQGPGGRGQVRGVAHHGRAGAGRADGGAHARQPHRPQVEGAARDHAGQDQARAGRCAGSPAQPCLTLAVLQQHGSGPASCCWCRCRVVGRETDALTALTGSVAYQWCPQKGTIGWAAFQASARGGHTLASTPQGDDKGERRRDRAQPARPGARAARRLWCAPPTPLP